MNFRDLFFSFSPASRSRRLGDRLDSLSKQITLRVLILSLMGLIGIATTMTLGLTAQLQQIEKRLEKVSTASARSFDLFFLKTESDLLATSASLAASKNPREVLRSMLSRNPSFVDILLVDLEGAVLAQRSRVGRPKLSQIEKQPWLESQLSVGEVYVSRVNFQERSPWVEMAVVVTDDIELPVATLVVKIDLTELWNQTIEIKVGQSGYVYIADESGQLVAYRNRRQPQSGLTLEDLVGLSPEAIASSRSNFYTGLDGQKVFATAQPLEIVPWFAIVEQPASEALKPSILPIAIWLAVIFSAGFLVYNIIIFTRRRIVLPLGILEDAVSRMSSGEWDFRVQVKQLDELGTLAKSFNLMAKQLQNSFATLDRQNSQLLALNQELDKALDAELKLIEAANRFVPNEFLSFLGYESLADVELGDAVEKEMSILFSDIRHFTTLSENMTPEENFKFINAYLSRMEPAIFNNHGFIDKYVGDAIMALFGESADDALRGAISMLELLAEYNTTRGRPGRPKIKIGIGINTGFLMLGTVGGYSRMDGTVISDSVNLASRIEQLTKNYGLSLLLSQYTFLKLKNPHDYAIRFIDKVKVKGKSELVTVYEAFDADPIDVREGKLFTKNTFEEALLLYELQRFEEAEEMFKRCLKINPQDRVSEIYCDRCQEKLSSNLTRFIG